MTEHPRWPDGSLVVMAPRPYPDGMWWVSWEQTIDEVVDWLGLGHAYTEATAAEAQIADLQRMETAGTVRNIRLRVYDLVERTDP